MHSVDRLPMPPLRARGAEAAAPRVLVLAEWFLPGFKAGGPIRTLANIIDRVRGIRWLVLTRDRDLSDTAPYPGVQAERWNPGVGAEVYYASRRSLGWVGMCRLLRRSRYEVLYLNSFFSRRFAIQPLLLRRLGVVPPVPAVLAPRGEFSPGALAINPYRKRAYVALARALGLCRGVRWHASTEEEARHIRAVFGAAARVWVAPNPGSARAGDLPPLPRRQGSALRLAFLSRLSPKKNLAGALRILAGVRSEVRLDVYGPAEDAAYLRECEEAVAALPPNVQVAFHGALPHGDVVKVLAAHDLFFLPTLGENFGHVVLEALLAGCPLLLSDQTPWRDLEARGIGWDLPLAEPDRFRGVIERCAAMDADEHARLARAAREAGTRYLESDEGVAATAELFMEAAARR